MPRKICLNKVLTVLLSIAVSVGCASDPVNNSDNVSPAPNAEFSSSSLSSQPSQSSIAAGQDQQKVTNAKTASTSEAVDNTVPGKPVVAKEEIDYSDQFVNGKKLSIPKVTGSVPPRDDSYHDTDNNAIVTLQSPTLAMADFPRDRRKEVDWVKTLDQGHIEPRANLKGGDEMMTMDLDIIMKNTQFMPWVKFPHLAHTKWLACQNCHPKIFIPQEHANPISMNKVLRGEFCGVCHDKVSFALFICERCHSVPHEGSGPAWWKE